MSARFLAAIKQGVLIGDGAMGTMLQQCGLAAGECPERLNLSAPDTVARIHRAYVDAGAKLVETNTFGGNPVRLARYGLADQAAEINKRAVEIARAAVGDEVMVLGSMGPLGELVAPYGDIEPEAAEAAFAVQAEAFAAAGADACIVETMADLTEALIAVRAARAAGLPVIASLSYEVSGRTFMGVAPAQAVEELAAAGADMVGANCSVGPAEMLAVVQALVSASSLPVSAMPNAGLPTVVDGAVQWPLGPAEFAAWGRRLAEAGVRLLGGCCGTTPAHIEALAATCAAV